MPTIAELKKNRNTLLNKAKATLEKTQTKEQTQYNDDRFWYPKTDKAGNSIAVIRFLPPLDSENDDPFVTFFEHNFKGPNGYYKANCLTSLGKKDPVQEFIKAHDLWNGSEDDKKLARIMKRKQTCIANIYVINDTVNPENNGKVFLYRFGQQILNKIMGAMNPELEGDEKVDPFDLWENGANFRVKVVTRQDGTNKYPNYENSTFEAMKPLFSNDPGDKKLEAVWKQVYDLKEFLEFKPKEELQKMLDEVMGTGEDKPVDEDPAPSDEPAPSRAKSVAERIAKNKAEVQDEVETPELGSDDDDELAELRKLADDVQNEVD